MAIYCFTCNEHRDQGREVWCQWSQLERLTPTCEVCTVPMRRDYMAEHYGGIANRSKGIYPLTCENLGQEPVVVGSASEHRRILKSKGLAINEPTGEHKYMQKHAKDRRR